jgi:catechol 2,3-dioxygenase-like lactoylglutathione lyase family enzyme
MTLSIEKMAAIGVNCTNIVKSRDFYEQLGLQAFQQNSLHLQDGSRIGLSGVAQWHSCQLQDHRGQGGGAIELCQWLQPLSCENASGEPNRSGFARIALYVPDLDVLYRFLQEARVAGLSDLYCDEPSALRWCYCRDPDGILVELVEHRGQTEIAYVVLNTGNLAKSIAWYNVLFDLEPGPVQRLGIAPQLLNDHKPGQVMSVQMNVPGQLDRMGLVLQQWQVPEAVGQPLLQANDTGIFRLVFSVSDIEQSYDYLCSEKIDCPYLPYELLAAEISGDDSGGDGSGDGEKVKKLLMPDNTGASIELLQRVCGD